MPKNLRHIFRSELIKQRKSGLRVARDAIKKSKNGKYADYRHIYSDNSYRKHWGRAQKFAEYCKQNGVKSLNEITQNLPDRIWCLRGINLCVVIRAILPLQSLLMPLWLIIL